MSKVDLTTIGNILYIDDDPQNSGLMKRVLEADGYKVSLASDGLMGLIQAGREIPDLILLDVQMPGMNGYEVARSLRQMEHTRDIPILFVSASRTSQDEYLSNQVGANGYIAKPIDVDHISQQIAPFIGVEIPT